MNLYLIRHAETELNAKGIHQGDDSVLSIKGMEEASTLSDQFKDVPFDYVITSPMIRAIQTTQIICFDRDIEIEASELATKINRPSEIVGKKMDDPYVKYIFDKISKNYGKKNWRFSDEETFKQTIMRIKHLLIYLESLDKKNVLLVTHGSYLTMIIMYLVFRDKLNPKSVIKELESREFPNLGISYVEYNAKSWNVVCYNSTAADCLMRKYDPKLKQKFMVNQKYFIYS